MALSDDLAHPVDGMVIHASQPHWALGEFGPCLIAVWRGAVTAEALVVINEKIWNLTQRRPGACAFVTVIEQNSPPPSAPNRKLAMEGLSRPGKALGCKCAVFEGNEFRTALVRAIMTGMALLRRQDQPSKFVKTLPELATWVQAQIRAAGGEVDSNDIVRACEQIRRGMPR